MNYYGDRKTFLCIEYLTFVMSMRDKSFVNFGERRI